MKYKILMNKIQISKPILYICFVILIYLAGLSAYQTVQLFVLKEENQKLFSQIQLAKNRIACSEKVLKIFSRIRQNQFIITIEDQIALEELN